MLRNQKFQISSRRCPADAHSGTHGFGVDSLGIQLFDHISHFVTSGGFAAAYNILEPRFEAETGVNLITSYGSSSGGATDSIPVRLARGEQFDVVIMSRPSLDRLNSRGDIVALTRTNLVKSTIGAAVRVGTPIPDISTEDAFLRTLRNAKSIGYSASASGTYLSKSLWPKLGIWKEIESKSTRVLNERVASVVARGELEIGFQQISEILPIAGVELVGPIPESLQKVTVFAAAITQRAKNPEVAWMLIEYLASKQVAKVISSTGLVPVVSINASAEAETETETETETAVQTQLPQ